MSKSPSPSMSASSVLEAFKKVFVIIFILLKRPLLFLYQAIVLEPLSATTISIYPSLSKSPVEMSYVLDKVTLLIGSAKSKILVWEKEVIL